MANINLTYKVDLKLFGSNQKHNIHFNVKDVSA